VKDSPSVNIATIATAAEMSAWSDSVRARGQTIAFVPTMGALHAGHVALLHDARRRADRLVLSVFVNPTQFGPNEDFSRYPRDLNADLLAATPAGTDVAFVPSPAEMYPAGSQTYVQVRELEKGLCGDFRPEHFVGVATVVCKLFNIVRPNVAVFGEKDFQQLAVIRRMVRDLNMPVEVIGMTTVREPDGLAMSSRNRYLAPDERRRAVSLSQALFSARARHDAGERNARLLVEHATDAIGAQVDRFDYLDIRDAESLAPLETISGPAVMAVAAFVGRTRLIDNVRLG